MYALNHPCYRDIIGVFNAERAKTWEEEDVDLSLVLFSFGFFMNPFGAEFYHVNDVNNSASGVVFYNSVLTALHAFQSSDDELPEFWELERRLQQEKDYAELHNLRVANYRIQNCLKLAFTYVLLEDIIDTRIFPSPEQIPLPSLHYFTMFLNPVLDNNRQIRPICPHLHCSNLQCYINFFQMGNREWNAPRVNNVVIINNFVIITPELLYSLFGNRNNVIQLPF
ncbi:unnamed protein product [Caenorhabditis brenneri]